MKALVCEKKCFESNNGDVYYTLVLSTYNEHFKDIRIYQVKDKKTGVYVPRNWFIDKSLYDEIEAGNWYDLIFGIDNENGRSKLVTAKLLK